MGFVPLYLGQIHFLSWKLRQNWKKSWQRVVPLSPHRSLADPDLFERSRSRVKETLAEKRELWALRCSVPVWKKRLLSQDVCRADIVNHMTDGSSADYSLLTFGIASNIFDKLASFYIWFNPQYKSHENSKLKIIKWAGNNQIPHICPPNDRFFPCWNSTKGARIFPSSLELIAAFYLLLQSN